MGSGKDADRNMPGKPGSAICATDSEPNPLGDVPSAPSHRNRGAAREEIYWKPFRPNAIPLGRREECRDDLATGKTQVVVIKCRVRRKGRCILHNRYRARSGIHRELCVLPAWRGNDLGTRLLSWAIAPFDATGVDDLELMVVE